MKYLLLIAFLFAVVWILRRSSVRGDVEQARPELRDSEAMVKCAHCGVNQPISESILTHGRYYCSNAHRLEAEAKER